MIRQQDKFAALQNLGEKIEIGGEGKDVTVGASISVESFVKVLTFIHENRAGLRQEDEDDE